MNSYLDPATAFHQLTALVLAAKRVPRRRRYCGQEWPLRECEMGSRQMRRRLGRGRGCDVATSSYKVWDKRNESEHHAHTIQAVSASDAAETYAEDDTDGGIDGIYSGNGSEICVRDEDGQLHAFLVSVEYTPTYTASPVETDEPEPCCGEFGTGSGEHCDECEVVNA